MALYTSTSSLNAAVMEEQCPHEFHRSMDGARAEVVLGTKSFLFVQLSSAVALIGMSLGDHVARRLYERALQGKPSEMPIPLFLIPFESIVNPSGGKGIIPKFVSVEMRLAYICIAATLLRHTDGEGPYICKFPVLDPHICKVTFFRSLVVNKWIILTRGCRMSQCH
jgi:hypothetical protein